MTDDTITRSELLNQLEYEAGVYKGHLELADRSRRNIVEMLRLTPHIKLTGLVISDVAGVSRQTAYNWLRAARRR